jgi:hypothetical protein
MSLRRSATVLPFLALGACAETVITDIQGRLKIAGAPIDDCGVQAVGVPTFLEIQLTAEQGNVPVQAMRVTNLDGAASNFLTVAEYLEIAGTDALPEGVPSVSGTVNIGRGDDFFYPIVYWPRAEGYHRAEVRFSFTGRGDDQGEAFELRCRADEPEVAIYPWTLDLGSVEVGRPREATITVDNRSALPVVLGHSFQNGQIVEGPWSTRQAPGVAYRIEPGLPPQTFTVVYTPLNEDPAQNAITFSLGDNAVQTVQLVANDCETGDPAAHDRDDDGYTTCGGDCDDDNEAVNPSGTEVLDGVDNDCDGAADDGTRGSDDDGDGYCEAPTSCFGSGILPGDCNDGDDRVNPGNDEDCPGDGAVCLDGLDNDCDGVTDGGTDDNDGDGYAEGAGDCDDAEPTIFPFAPELPDRKDNDCDGTSDEGTVLFDNDGDGYCVGDRRFVGCTIGFATGDCDDRPATGPGAAPGASAYPRANPNDPLNETADRRDNDCDGLIDEGTAFYDGDGDGYTPNAGDCNDASDTVGPHRLEIPGNGVDDDCDFRTPGSGPI